MKRRRTTCFVAAPYGIDTHVLREELSRRGVEWFDATNAPMRSSFVVGIREAIADCDFLCAVLCDTASRKHDLLEVGIAVGLAKPVLMIADRDVHVPSDLSVFQRILADASDRSAIGFHLDLFLDSFKTRHYEYESNRKASRPSHTTFHSIAESNVARLFEEAGFLLHEVKGSRGARQIDLAVWIDEMEPVFGSPLLVVEVKNRWQRRATEAAIRQVASYVQMVNAGAGLIVYLSGEPVVASGSADPFVFAVSVSDLGNWLQGGQFAERMRDLRNRAVHGY